MNACYIFKPNMLETTTASMACLKPANYQGIMICPDVVAAASAHLMTGL